LHSVSNWPPVQVSSVTAQQQQQQQQYVLLSRVSSTNVVCLIICLLKLARGLCAFADGTLNVVHVLVSTALAGITQVGKAMNVT
jgi:hypothetical protein